MFLSKLEPANPPKSRKRCELLSNVRPDINENIVRRYGVIKNFVGRRFFLKSEVGAGGKEGRSVPSVLALGPEKNEHCYALPNSLR